MPLFSYGINHQSTPLAIRERLAVNAEHIPQTLTRLCQVNAVNEAVLISTCNRTEIYMVGEHPEPVQQWFQQQTNAVIDLKPHGYLHQDIAAVRHLLRVGSGLDSMVLGEAQILGQIKQAYRTACSAGTVGQQLRHLFPASFAIAKQIRQQTQIGANPVSMAYASVQLAKRIFTHLPNCCVLLVGAGELMELMITHLAAHGVRHLIVANRTTDKAEQLAKPYQAQAIRIGDIPAYLPQVDIVITATASQLPIIGKGLVERTLKAKKRRPILMIDLAVPRDIEPEVGQLADIYLYNIDDLKAIIDANLKNRAAAASQAEALIELQAVHYMRQLQVVGIGDIIEQFRRQAQQQRDAALQKSLTELQQGRDPATVLSHLAHQLTNKLLHHPTLKLRHAAYNQQVDVLLLAKELLMLPEQ